MEEAQTIREIMIPVQDVINMDEAIQLARRRFESEARRSLIVVDGSTPVGVLEWRKIMRDSGDLDDSPVSSVMSRDYPELTDDMTIEEASGRIGDLDVSTIPVVDETGHLVGEVPRSAFVQREAAIEDVRSSPTTLDEPVAAFATRMAPLEKGMTVAGAGGSKLGEVNDVIVGASGQLDAITVAHGLFGRKHKRVPADLITDVDDDHVVLVIDTPEFKSLPDAEPIGESS